MPRDHIFISYRRDDSRGASGRLFDWLRIAFGRERVFRDVHSIGVGLWRDKIDQALDRTVVCVVVLGRRWADADNLSRLREPTDMVRYELKRALDAAGDGLIIVPTLVEDALLPPKDIVPEELQPVLSDWNVRNVSESGWEDDTQRLITEIAEATRLSVRGDVAALLNGAAAADEHIAASAVLDRLHADQVRELSTTVDRLIHQLAETASSERRIATEEAVFALARGDTIAAEEAFERESMARQRSEESEREARADALCNVANLAILRDVEKAASFYQQAIEVKPVSKTYRLLGYALIRLGDLHAAARAFQAALDLAREQKDDWERMAGWIAMGTVFQAMGDLPRSLKAFRTASTLCKQEAELAPVAPRWQRSRAVSYIKLGDTLSAQGDRAALEAYQSALNICQALVDTDAGNVEWQRDLSVCHSSVGDWLGSIDPSGALRHYSAALAIREALARREPSNPISLRDLHIVHTKIGDLQVTQGDQVGALRERRIAHGLAEKLAMRDRSNAEWQRDLAVSHIRIGDLIFAGGNIDGALAFFQAASAISESLVKLDSANAIWLHDHSIALDRMAKVFDARGDADSGIHAQRSSLSIRELLIKRDPSNEHWQRDLWVSMTCLGEMLMRQGRLADALAQFVAAQDLMDSLYESDGGSKWEKELGVCYTNVANVLREQCDSERLSMVLERARKNGMSVRELCDASLAVVSINIVYEHSQACLPREDDGTMCL